MRDWYKSSATNACDAGERLMVDTVGVMVLLRVLSGAARVRGRRSAGGDDGNRDEMRSVSAWSQQTSTRDSPLSGLARPPSTS
jgi:hypothetical protein